MKKRYPALEAALLGIGLILLAGCATRELPEKGKADGVAVIPLIHERQEGLVPFGYYTLNIKSADSEKVKAKAKIPADLDYLFIDKLPPGEYYVDSHFFRYNSKDGTEDTGSFEKGAYSFSVESGYLTVTDFYFGVKLTARGVGFGTKRVIDLIDAEDSDGSIRAGTIKGLEEDYPQAFDGWMIK